jgi:succinate dehydrogenase / fumarate reductase cytochrome b subunit
MSASDSQAWTTAQGNLLRARPLSFLDSTVGKKLVMSLTGAILSLFIVAHLLGNLLIFAGRDALNAYAAALKSVPELLWVARLVLLAALVLHVLYAVELTIINWRARPGIALRRRDVETSYAARTMIVSGPLLLLYAVYHLMMFTFLTTGPGYSPTDVYANVMAAFQVPAITAVYVVALLLLGLHLYHGLWSMLHTAGISKPGYKRWRQITAPIVAVVITIGYIVIPLSVLAGWVR